MNKAEFLKELKDSISDMPYSEVEKTLSFYAENIDDRMEDGMSEDEAVFCLGDIDAIAKEIRVDLPITTLIGKKVKQSRDRASNKTLWIVLAICGIPFWLPIASAFTVTVLAVYFSIWAVIISIYAVVFAFAFAAIGSVLAGIICMFTAGFYQGAILIGSSLCLAGLFMMTVRPMFWLCKKMVRLTGTFFKWVKSLFVSKEVKV